MSYHRLPTTPLASRLREAGGSAVDNRPPQGSTYLRPKSVQSSGATSECTVGLLDENDKLAKLVQRTKLIRDKLNGTGYAFIQLQAVIVTPLSCNEVTANLETAGKHDIAVVCKEDIEDMLSQVSLPSNADRLFEDAKRLVPNAGQGSLFGNNQ